MRNLLILDYFLSSANSSLPQIFSNQHRQTEVKDLRELHLLYTAYTMDPPDSKEELSSPLSASGLTASTENKPAKRKSLCLEKKTTYPDVLMIGKYVNDGCIAHTRSRLLSELCQLQSPSKLRHQTEVKGLQEPLLLYTAYTMDPRDHREELLSPPSASDRTSSTEKISPPRESPSAWRRRQRLLT